MQEQHTYWLRQARPQWMIRSASTCSAATSSTQQLNKKHLSPFHACLFKNILIQSMGFSSLMQEYISHRSHYQARMYYTIIKQFSQFSNDYRKTKTKVILLGPITTGDNKVISQSKFLKITYNLRKPWENAQN